MSSAELKPPLDSQPVARPQARRRQPLSMVLLKARTFIALIVLVIFFSILSPNFLTPESLIITIKHIAINAIIAVGMTFVIVSGGIDLSVGSVVGLAGMIAGLLIDQGLVLPMFGVIVYMRVWLIVLVALIAGTLIGALNGWVIAKLNVAPFIATLGTMYAARGFALLSNNGATFPNLVGRPELGNTGFPWIGAGLILGIPVPIWLMIVIGLVAAFVATRTPFGRHVFAIGGNERAATLSGVRVNPTKILVYMISGFCSALAGLIVSSQLVASHPASGTSFELNAIASAVLGGTSMSGGRGSIGGTIVGAFVIGVLSDGLIMVGISDFWQTVIKGFVIVLAVAVDQAQVRMQAVAALQQERG
ncbi:MAG TPA: ABC transporter permease [Anaerolineaceae bacterium]|nr:ABC transporter permease [Anaerolineaceae bacterium]